MNVMFYLACKSRLVFTLPEQLAGDLLPCCGSVSVDAVSWALADVNYCPTCLMCIQHLDVFFFYINQRK